MTNLLQRTLIALLIGFVLAGPPLGVSAQNTGQNLDCNGTKCSFANPLGQTTTLCKFLKKIFDAAVSVLIPVAALFIIWSGFKFVFAQGKPKELKQARQNFYFTVIGVGVFLGGWILVMAIVALVNNISGSTIISC